MPGPCVHLTSRVILMLLNGAAGILLVAALLMNIFTVQTHVNTVRANTSSTMVDVDMSMTFTTLGAFTAYGDVVQAVSDFEARTQGKASVAFGVIGAVGCALNFVLSAILLGIQNKWNHGKECCVNQERGFGITVLVVSFVNFFCGILTMAMLVGLTNAYKDMYTPLPGPSYNNVSDTQVTFTGTVVGPSQIVGIVAFIVLVICLALAVIPCLLGLQYCGCWGAGMGGGGSDSEEEGNDEDEADDDNMSRRSSKRSSVPTGVYNGMSAAERREAALRRARSKENVSDDEESV